MSDEMTAEEFVASRKKNLYGNTRVVIDGIKFQSKAEGARYERLRDLQNVGAIRDLVLQPRYPLVVNNIRVGTYVGDFLYYDALNDQPVLEDVKGVRKEVYRLKKKLVAALYAIDITEVEVRDVRR